MEAMLQLGEIYIQAYGCPTSQITGGVDIYASQSGVGDSTLWTPGGVYKMIASKTASDSFRGDKYRVSSATGTIAGRNFVGLLGNYRYNKNGSIMEGDAVLSVPNPTASGTPDNFTSRVIKDFFIYKQVYQGVLRDFTLDWGLQVVNKLSYPVSKYFQRSFSVKDDGIEGVTRFEKTRIAGGIPCTIAIQTKGLNNTEQFNEQGGFVIRKFVAVPLPNVR
jgi:hypothetical protein